MFCTRIIRTTLPVISCIHFAAVACGAADNPATSVPEVSVPAGDTAAFRAAVQNAQPGAVISLPPGEYGGSFFLTRVTGEAGNPIVITGADPDNPPRFTGGTEGLHFVEPAYLEIRNLEISGQGTNGLNIDDGGTFDSPAHHVVIQNLHVFDVGPDGGNRDGIKLSGVVDFEVRDCLVERWGDGGSGIDMVGCHRGLIHDNTFRHGDETGSNSVQAKGGTTEVTVRRNRFEHGGSRAVNIGGSTGLQFFRPNPHQGFEAKDITVEGNIFIGSAAPVAFVNVDGSTFRYNTLYRPTRWVLRILQEITEAGFVPSRNGVFTDNLIVFRQSELSTFVNIGPNTAPETFTFARNLWYAEDDPTNSTPALPSDELDGIVGVDPGLADPSSGDFSLDSNSPSQASNVGAHALPE